MKERHWISLVTSVRHGQCVLVLGPEIPAQVGVDASGDGVPGTVIDELRKVLASELEEDGRPIKGDSLPAVAQQYEDAQGFGPSSLRALAQRFFRSTEATPSAVHTTLASLPFGLILTTSQDHLLVRALEDAGKEPISQRYHLRGDLRDNPEFPIPSSPTTPLLYHLFGDAEEPASLVLSENDLLDFLVAIVAERPPLPNSLVRALRRGEQSFLFVGFGVRHWYLRVLLKVLMRALELRRSGSAVATESLQGLTESDREQIVLFYQRGTRVELEDTDTGAFLAELHQRLEAEGGFAGDSGPAGPRPRVFISYAREDGGLAAVVFDVLRRSNFEPWMDSESLHGGDQWDDRIEDELEATDFTLVLYTPELCRKTDSYVNKEIALAQQRGMRVRGPFVIPLRTAEIADEERISELSEYHEMMLRPEHVEEDMSKVISTMRRDYQRRHR